MLSRPLAILHPHTQQELFVHIEMDYDKESTESPSNVDGAVYLSVTLRRIDQALYLSVGPNLWRTRPTQQVTFSRMSEPETAQQPSESSSILR